ncbi:MAG: Hpt domain-containing protein [Chitinophagales bacterium]
MTENGLIDLSFLKIYSGNNPETIKKLITSFLEKTPPQVQQLEQQIETKDYAQLTRTAHSMKPPVSYMGMKVITEKIAAIEEAARSETKLDSLPAMIAEVKSLIEKASHELRAHMSQL